MIRFILQLKTTLFLFRMRAVPRTADFIVYFIFFVALSYARASHTTT